MRRIAAARLLSARFGPSKSVHDLKVAALPEDLWYCALQGLLYDQSPTARAAAAAAHVAVAGRRATRAEAAAFAAEAVLHVNRTDDDSIGSNRNRNRSSSGSSGVALTGGEWPLTAHRLWTRVVPHAFRGCLQVLTLKKRPIQRLPFLTVIGLSCAHYVIISYFYGVGCILSLPVSKRWFP